MLFLYTGYCVVTMADLFSAPEAFLGVYSQVDAQRQAKNAAQSVAERALQNLAAALKKMSAFDKEKARLENNHPPASTQNFRTFL